MSRRSPRGERRAARPRATRNLLAVVLRDLSRAFAATSGEDVGLEPAARASALICFLRQRLQSSEQPMLSENFADAPEAPAGRSYLPFRNGSALAFRLSWAASRGRRTRCARRSDRGSSEGGRMPKTVMIVEDNELNMKLFHDLLEAHGYHTVGTRNGIEALDLARKHRPDLILMDIQLPEVSGLEVTKWLKEDPELKTIPVVAVTAFAMKGDEERIRQGGCEAYLSKPISVGKFIETVRQFLGTT